MSVSSFGFVAFLATVQSLRSLTNQVLELCRLDEIGVPYQVFLSTQFRPLNFVKMSCNTVLPSCMLQSDSVFPSSNCLPSKINHCWSGWMPSLSFTLAMVSLVFDIERNCPASHNLDDDLHVTTQAIRAWCNSASSLRHEFRPQSSA